MPLILRLMIHDVIVSFDDEGASHGDEGVKISISFPMMTSPSGAGEKGGGDLSICKCECQ